ncbi:unnamed protein product [Ceratitis capitata]|nr:unnamed protein product [Ceratitis capitata]
MSDAIKDLRTKTEELKGQIRNLKHLIVPEEEGKQLQIQLSKLQENISECDQQIRNAESNLKTHIVDNNRLQEISKVVECAKEILSTDFVDSFNEAAKKLDNAKEKIACYEKEIEQLTQLINRHQKALECWQEKSKLDQRQHDDEKQKLHQIIISKTKERDVSAAKTDNFKVEVLAVEASIKDQQDIQSYVQENIAILMKGYK